MSESSALFQAVISVIDHATGPLKLINEQLEHLQKPMAPLAEAVEHLRHQFHEFDEFSGLEKMRENLHELRESCGELGEKLGEIFEPVMALGAAGSLIGLVELQEKAVEFGASLHEAAEQTGVAVEQLAVFRYATEQANVPIEALDHGLEKLNRGIALAAAGKNKDLAALFRHLHISLRDANGELKNAGDLMPLLAEAFSQNENEAVRARMSVALFGRSGQDLLPVLAGGKEGLEEMSKAAERFGLTLSKEDAESAHKMEESWKDLESAVKGVTLAIGRQLFPVLRPLVERLTEWIAANRELIADKVEKKIEVLAHWIEQIDWEKFGDSVEKVTTFFNDLTDSVGGGSSAMILMTALMLGPFISGFLEVGAIVMSLSGMLIRGLAAGFIYAAGAIAELMIALEAGTGVMAAFDAVMDANPIGLFCIAAAALAAVAYEVWSHWEPIKNFFVDLWDGVTGAFDRAWAHIQPIIDKVVAGAKVLTDLMPSFDHPDHSHGGAKGLLADAGGGRSLTAGLQPRNALAAPDPAARDGHVSVKVELAGAPPGTRTQVRSSGAVKTQPVDVGQSFGGMRPVGVF